MVFPIILGSGTPKPTPTTNKHTFTTKKNTQKGPPPPGLTASLPAVSFFASAQLAPSTQSQHQSRSLSSLLLWLCLNFTRADRQVCPGFLSFRLRVWETLYPPLNGFVIPVGEGFREATRHRTPGAQWLGPPRGAWNFSLKAQQPNSKVPGSVSKGGEAGDSFRQNSWRQLEGTHEP